MVKISASAKDELRAYYQRTQAPIDETEKARVVAIVSEEAATLSYTDPPSPTPFWRFLVGQLRFVSPLAWLCQIALLAGMLITVGALAESESGILVVMVAAVLSVAIAAPPVFKSFEDNVSELEGSCLHDSTQVLLSRLILFGLADVLWMSIAACIVPTLASGDPFRVFLYAATPFFAFCALCFYLSRKMQGRCVRACAGAAVCVVLALWASNSMFPYWYTEASLFIWTLALVASLALAVYEARRLIVQVANRDLAYALNYA